MLKVWLNIIYVHSQNYLQWKVIDILEVYVFQIANLIQLLTGYNGKIWLVGFEVTNDATNKRPSTKFVSEVPTNYFSQQPLCYTFHYCRFKY